MQFHLGQIQPVCLIQHGSSPTAWVQKPAQALDRCVPWGRSLITALYLSYFLCEMGILVLPTSEGCWEDKLC